MLDNLCSVISYGAVGQEFNVNESNVYMCVCVYTHVLIYLIYIYIYINKIKCL